MTKKQFFWEQAKWMIIVALYLDASSVYLKEHFCGVRPDPVTIPSIELHRMFFGDRFLDMAWGTLGMIYFPIQNMYTQLAVMLVLFGGG